MFKRALTTSLRFSSRFQQKKLPNFVAITGTTSLGIAFFGKSEEKKSAENVENAGISENLATGKPKNFDLIVSNADELYDNYLIDNCYNILKKFENSQCSELLWRLARVVCEKGKLCKDQKERQKLILEAYEIVKKALENEDREGSFGAHKCYRVLEQLKMCMYKNQSMLHIKSKKVILFEPRRSSELSAVMDEFDEAIFNPTRFGATINGALMFAVFRGKVSEGIDFADDRARVVISVGIPYPNAMDDQVNAKKMYNDQNSKEMGILNGDEWYTTQAYRALNQALGRCLRHKNDWGAMLMIDDRLERQTSQLTTGASSARVSKWIRAQLKSYPSFRQFNANFREFIERRLSIVKKEQEDA